MRSGLAATGGHGIMRRTRAAPRPNFFREAWGLGFNVPPAWRTADKDGLLTYRRNDVNDKWRGKFCRPDTEATPTLSRMCIAASRAVAVSKRPASAST